jgi:hypothetical protein
VSRQQSGYILGYHGCDAEIGEEVLAGKIQLEHSDRDYDWLGPGIYFWEGDAKRAFEWASQRIARKRSGSPFVLGAVLELRDCLDLTQRENIELLEFAYKGALKSAKKSGQALPKNKDSKYASKGNKLLRFLDCAVIKYLHDTLEQQNFEPFDAVRGLFVEGKPVYPGARFYTHTHSQIAIRNSDCIRGVFRADHLLR